MMLKDFMGKKESPAGRLAKVNEMERKSLQQIKAMEGRKAELMRQQVEGRLAAEESGGAFDGEIFEKLLRVDAELSAERQYCKALHQRKIGQIRAIRQAEADKFAAEHAALQIEVEALEQKLKALHSQKRLIEDEQTVKYKRALLIQGRMEPGRIGGIYQGTLGELVAMIDTESIAASALDWASTCDEIRAEVQQRFKGIDVEEVTATISVDDEGNIETYRITAPPR